MLVTMKGSAPSATAPGDHYASIKRIQHPADTAEHIESDGRANEGPSQPGCPITSAVGNGLVEDGDDDADAECAGTREIQSRCHALTTSLQSCRVEILPQPI